MRDDGAKEAAGTVVEADEGADAEDELARYRELEAVATSLEQQAASRWVAMAGFGLVAIATSTMSWWWVAQAPTAVVAETSPPLLVWAGFVLAVVAMAGIVLRPERWPRAAPAVVLVGALLVAIGSGIAAGHVAPGSAPWLALCGALVTSTAVVAGLSHARARLGRWVPSRTAVTTGRSDPRPGAVGRSPSWVDLRNRAWRLSPGAAGDRLAVASLTVLLLAVVLPWGEEIYDRPLVLPQATYPGALLVATMAAALVATVSVVWLGAIDSAGLREVEAIVGFVVVVGSLPVRLDDVVPLPLVVPGRVAAFVGGLGLIVASGVRAGRAGRWAQLIGARPLARRDREAIARRQVEELLGGNVSPTRERGWGGAALVLVVAGGFGLTGPWWRSPFELHGPYERGWNFREVLLEGGQSAAIARSGIDVVGTVGAWVVAVAAVVATVAAVVLGVRRSALVVAASAAGLTAVAVVGLARGRVGGTVLPWMVTIAGVAAVGIAGRAWWSGTAGRWRYLAVLPAVVVGLSAMVAVVDAPAYTLHPTTDGPFRVLVGGESSLAEAGAVTVGTPAEEMAADRAVWFHGEPAVVDGTSHGVVLWVVRDGRAEILGVADGSVGGPEAGPEADGSADDTILMLGDFGGAPVLWTIGQRTRPLPRGSWMASLGPDGHVWMVTGPGGGGAEPIHVAPAHELSTDGAESSNVDEWPAVPVGQGNISGIRATEGAALLVVAEEDRHRLVLVRPDGSTRTVLGGAPDPSCGVNRQATGSELDLGVVELEDDSSYGNSVALLPLSAAVPTPDGGLWLVLPAARPTGDRVHALGRVDPDGTVRRVEHALPPVSSIEPSPDGDSVLVVDQGGRVLELRDATRHAAPLPPPPAGCYTETPTVAPSARLTRIPGRASDGTLLATDGTRLHIDGEWDGPHDMVRTTPDGEDETVMHSAEKIHRAVIVSDGAGGAWWLSEAEEDWRDPTTEVHPIHVLASGDVDQSAPTIAIGAGPNDLSAHVGIWADGDTAYVFDNGGQPGRPRSNRLSRVTSGSLRTVHLGEDPSSLHRDGALVVTRGGHLLSHTDGRVVRVLADRVEPLVGRTTQPEPARTLPVQIADGVTPDQLFLDGALVADPRGDGALLVQDGLLVRIGLDGSITPLAQDSRLVGAARLLDGQVVVDDAEGVSYVVDVP